MKKRTLLLATLASLLLFSCGEEPDFVDVSTKVIAPTESPKNAGTEDTNDSEELVTTDDTEPVFEESVTEKSDTDESTAAELDTTEPEIGEIVWLDKDMTVSYVDGKIKVNLRIGNEVLYYDDVIINRYYDSLFAKSEEKPIFIKEEENGKYTLSVYKYGRMQSGITCDEFITVGKFIIINNGLYDYNLNCLYNFYDQYSGGIDVAEFYEDENSSNITISGLSRSGKPVTYRFYTSLTSGELSEDAKLIAELDYSDTTTALYRDKDSIYYSDSESRLNLTLPFGSNSVLHSSLYPRKAIFVRQQDSGIFGSAFEYCYISSPGLGRAPALFMTVDFRPEVTSFGDSELINLGGTYHIIKDGVYDRNLDYEFGYEIVGDFIYAYDGPTGYAGMVYNSRYEPISDGVLHYFTRLEDGRYIAMINENAPLAIIFDKDGNPVYKSDGNDSCLMVGADYMLMRSADDVVRLYSPDCELLCEFPEWSKDFYFHYKLSGTKTFDGVMGYYFTVEDPNDSKVYNEFGSYGNRAWMFYYIPTTGEYGVKDYGYLEFAYG